MSGPVLAKGRFAVADWWRAAVDIGSHIGPDPESRAGCR